MQNKFNLLKIYLFFFILLFFSNTSSAFNNDLFQKKYMKTNWDYTNGFPSNNALDIIQNNEGYIWIATYEGLIRYDGKKFELYNKYTHNNLEILSAVKLFEDSKKRLWIGSNGNGLAIYKNNKFEMLPKKVKLSSYIIRDIQEDSYGNIWIGTANGIDKLIQRKDKKWESKNIISGKHIKSLSIINNNRLIAVINTGEILTYSNEKVKNFLPYQKLKKYKFSAVTQDSKKNIWLGTNSSNIIEIDSKNNIKIHEFSEVSSINSIQELTDYYNNRKFIAVCSDNGFGVFNKIKDKFIYFGEKNGLINNSIENSFMDLEGNLWLASKRAGLEKLTKSKFITYNEDIGLSDNVINSIEEDSSGNYLIGTNSGMSVIKNEKIIKHKYSEYFKNIRIRHIFEDSSKNLWVSTYSSLGLVRIKNGNFKSINLKNGLSSNKVRVTFEDDRGWLWIGTGSGLNLIKNPNAENPEIINKFNDNFPNYVMCISEDSNGNILAGSDGNGLYIIDKNFNVKNISQKDGLAGNIIFKILSDKNNSIWISTSEGLSLWKNNNFFNFNVKDGFISDSIYQTLELDGKFWFTVSKGIFSISKSELVEQAALSKRKLKVKFYETSDGFSGSSTPTAWGLVDKNSNIWFPTIKGISVLSKRKKVLNDQRPKIIIQYIEIDGKKYFTDKIKNIPADTKRIKIKFSALSYKIPEKVKFKYFLKGFENQWNEETTSREAIYTNLHPGKYSFKVIACNNDNIWNPKAESFSFYKAPFFYETIAFKILVFVIILGIIIIIFQIRFRNIQKQKETLIKTVDEKTKELKKLAKNYKIKNTELVSNIEYAERIQKGILTDINLIKTKFQDFFILYLPRDIISGDFYWYNEIGEDIFIAVADCTGHGVSGAFLTSICHMLLDKHINESNKNKLDVALENINIEFKKIVGRNNNESLKGVCQSNGMDLGICKINKKENLLNFVGAKSSLIYLDKHQNLNRIKGTRKSIGYNFTKRKKERKFELHQLLLNEIDTIYLMSDGYVDQLNEENKCFNPQNLRVLLENKIHNKNLQQQKIIFIDELNKHMKSQRQTDDITIVGIKI